MPTENSSTARYGGLYARIVANTEVEGSEANGCWSWRRRTAGGGYPRVGVRRGSKRVELRPHRVMLVLTEMSVHGLDPGDDARALFWMLYDFYSLAGLDADHRCEGNPRCCNPDHLRWRDAYSNRTASRAVIRRTACADFDSRDAWYGVPAPTEDTGS